MLSDASSKLILRVHKATLGQNQNQNNSTSKTPQLANQKLKPGNHESKIERKLSKNIIFKTFQVPKPKLKDTQKHRT